MPQRRCAAPGAGSSLLRAEVPRTWEADADADADAAAAAAVTAAPLSPAHHPPTIPPTHPQADQFQLLRQQLFCNSDFWPCGPYAADEYDEGGYGGQSGVEGDDGWVHYDTRRALAGLLALLPVSCLC